MRFAKTIIIIGLAMTTSARQLTNNCNVNHCSICRDIDSGANLLVDVENKNRKNKIFKYCDQIINISFCCSRQATHDLFGTAYWSSVTLNIGPHNASTLVMRLCQFSYIFSKPKIIPISRFCSFFPITDFIFVW